MKIIMVDEPVKSLNGTLVCHSRESVGTLFQILTSFWIPTFAGMTTIYECIMVNYLKKQINNTTFSGETKGNASQISKNCLIALKSKFFEFCSISGPDFFAARFITVNTFFLELSQMCFFTRTEWKF
jgi:hypothetical protein